MEPNKENIKKWVDALRNDGFAQDKSWLHTNRGFCCLGVACEVAIKNSLPLSISKDDEYTFYDGMGGILPPSVQNWLGIDDSDPNLVKDGRYYRCSVLNDDKNFSFAAIADAIEATYLSV